MIRITIEMIPHGFENLKYKIAEGIIANNGTGTETKGNYKYKLLGKQGRLLKTGEVNNFPRLKKHVWHLIKKVLNDAY